VYDNIHATSTPDGTLGDEQMRAVIASAKQSVQTSQDFTPDQVFDFRFARQALQDLQAANWHGLWSN
jgi:hypothetical protein